LNGGVNPTTTTHQLNIAGTNSLWVQGNITAPGITNTTATSGLTYVVLENDILRHRTIAQVKTDLGVVDSIHNQSTSAQAATFWIQSSGTIGTDAAGKISITGTTMTSSTDYSFVTPRLYIGSVTKGSSNLGGVLTTWHTVINGGTTSSNALYINGRILSVNNITGFSDARLKSNIKTLDNFNVLDKIEGKSYIYNEKPSFGVIAQELKEVLPELVNMEENGYYSVDIISLLPFIIEYIKDNKRQINSLKEELNKLNK
jgi:hypothetical protein